MPLTSELVPFIIKTLPGMNSKIEDLELNAKYVEIAQNCRFSGEPGAVDKRQPVAYYNSTSLGSGAILGIYRFYSKSGTTKSICVWGTTAYVGDDSVADTPWTAIRSNLTTGKRTSFITYKDLTIAGNAFDNLYVFDGSSDNVTWELGACKAVTIAGGSNLDDSANYYYAVTIDNDAYVCGAVSNTVTTGAPGGNRKVSLSNIPLGPVGTVNRKIYRTEGGGSSLKLLATISNNTATTYTDDIADGALGAAYPAVTDDMPKGNILQIHRERFFVSGDPDNPNRIYYSNPYLPHYIQQTTNLDYMDIAADDGDIITGIPIQLGVLICIKRNTVRRVHITSATSGADPATWYAEDPLSFSGSPCPWSIVQTQRGVVFMGWDHWKIFNGAAVIDTIDEFDTADVLPGRYSEIFSYWLERDILIAAYTDTTDAKNYNDRLMRWDFKRGTLSFDTLNVNCIYANQGGGELGDVMYGDSVNGYVYKTDITDQLYKLQTKTQANLGTKNTTYVGGTESAPIIQIGSVTTADAIPNDVCIFWDNASTNPGSGWEEITGVNDKFVKISTTTVQTTGSITLSNGTEAVINYHKYRLFKKITGTTEYDLPVGAIVLYDQSEDPTGYVNVGSSGYYVQISGTPGTDYTRLPVSNDAGGTNLDQTVSFRFIKKVGEADTWDGLSKYVYVLLNASSAGTGFTDATSDYSDDYLIATTVSPSETDGDDSSISDPIKFSGTTHTYTGSDNTVGTGPETIDGNTATYWSTAGTDSASGSGGSFGSTRTEYSTHIFSYPRTITSITYRAWVQSSSSSSTDNACYARIYVQYTTDGTNWSYFTGGQVTSSGSNTTVTAGSTSSSTTITQTVTSVLGVRVGAGNAGSYHNENGSHSWDVRIYEVSCVANLGSYVTFRLAKKILGKFQDYNSAIESNTTTGNWISPGIQVNAETLKTMYWNELKLSTDEIDIYTRTGATQSSVESGTAIGTVNSTTDIFTQAGHGLSNGNRITLDASVMPTGLVKTIVYYVVGVSGNDFQVSLTSGGAAVDFSTNGTSVTFKKWTGPLSDPNGSTIGSSANVWIQYLIQFTCADSTADNPMVYFVGSYAVKFSYARGVTYAESAVPFRYRMGYRHFDQPLADKIFKKIVSYHIATQGDLVINWNTENSSGTFTLDLSNNQSKFESFFPSTAFGRKLNLEYYKNDTNDFKLKEINGLFTPEPILI